MTILFKMVALNNAANTNFTAKSGNVYTSDAYGIISAVEPGDVNDLEQSGCLSLGQDQVQNNPGTTTNPTVNDDVTKSYGAGSTWLNTSTGVMWVCTSGTDGAAVWTALNAAGYAGLPFVTGRFYGVPAGVTPVALLTVASVLYAYPVFVPNTVTLAAFQASVTSGQTGGKLEMGIYRDNGAGYPGALVAGTDTGDLDGTGTAVVGPTNLAVSLTPGWYWIAIQAAATSTMPSVAGGTVSYATELGKLLGSDSAAHNLAAGSQALGGIKKTALTYAPLLTTFPAGAVLVLNAGVPLASLGV